jgi:hypothetical protein
VSLPLGTALVATWTFTASGVLHDPSPVPTVIEASYPDGTVLAGLPLALTKIRTGVYQAQIFSAGQVTQVGTYSALAYSSDTTLDSPYGDGQASWQDVGVNSVSALTSTALGQFFAYLTSSVTTAGSWAKYISDTLATILSRTASSGGPFVSPVADDGITTIIYVSRDYNSADSWALIYPTSQTVLNTDTFSWSVGPFGSPYLTQAGTYYDANHIQVELTAAQTGGFGKYIGQSLDLEIRTTRATRKIEQVRGKAQIKGVVNP